MKYALAVFDLDGTILDTLDDLTASVNFALAKHGYPTRTKAEIRSFVGNGIGKLVERAVPAGIAKERRTEVLADFSSHYALHCADATSPYAGVPELLQALKSVGLRLAVISNKADFAVKELIPRYFGTVFDLAVGECENIRRKPCPDSLLSVISELSAAKSETVYIGDSEVDVQTAANAGVDCVSVTWGFRAADYLSSHGAKQLADTPAELLRLLLS